MQILNSGGHGWYHRNADCAPHIFAYFWMHLTYLQWQVLRPGLDRRPASSPLFCPSYGCSWETTKFQCSQEKVVRWTCLFLKRKCVFTAAQRRPQLDAFGFLFEFPFHNSSESWHAISINLDSTSQRARWWSCLLISSGQCLSRFAVPETVLWFSGGWVRGYDGLPRWIEERQILFKWATMLHAGATVKSLSKGEDQTRKGCPAVIPGPAGHFHVLGIA